MTSKLANSLRKSVSEEKNSVAKPASRTRTAKPKVEVQQKVETKSAQEIPQQSNSAKIDSMQKISETSKLLQLTNLTTEKFRIINQDIVNYLQEISAVKNVYNLSNLNVELIKKLTEHQQELFNESVNILNKKK